MLKSIVYCGYKTSYSRWLTPFILKNEAEKRDAYLQICKQTTNSYMLLCYLFKLEVFFLFFLTHSRRAPATPLHLDNHLVTFRLPDFSCVATSVPPVLYGFVLIEKH